MLDLSVPGAELMDGHVQMVASPVSVVRRDREHAARHDLGYRDVADVVGRLLPMRGDLYDGAKQKGLHGTKC